MHDWQADPFARGAYSYVTVGGTEARERLAAPLEDTLFFAGEAADAEGAAATVEGALRTGMRAAHEVRASLEASSGRARR
jgi:monoamine oxidase